jgi:uncharacterized protein
MAILQHILIFPIKSLDGVTVCQAEIAAGGALVGDREFAIVDQAGVWVNGKRTPKIHQVRSQFDLAQRRVTLSAPGVPGATFDLEGDRTELHAWLSDFFGFKVTLQQDLTTGFPDDPESPGPTIISISTLDTVAAWFPNLDIGEARARFRTNLEFGEVPAFWEDGLYSATAPLSFQIGAVHLQGVNPCQRCPVPTRSSITGEPWAQFQKTFVRQRQATLPDWAAAQRFNHFYRLAVNTRIAPTEVGKVLRVGDALIGGPSIPDSLSGGGAL